MTGYLLLFSHCILVKGAGRSSICDLQRNDIYPIPNTFSAMFKEDRYLDCTELSGMFSGPDAAAIQEYVSFLEDHELIFPCTRQELECFPGMSMEWLFPGQVSNCILDIDQSSTYLHTDVLSQLSALNCCFIQFRFFMAPERAYLEALLESLCHTGIKSVELLLRYSESVTDEDWAQWTLKFRFLNAIVLYGAPESGTVAEGRAGMGYVFKVMDSIKDATHCGIIDPGLFSPNILTFTEARSHNTCLNRKVSIDVQGNIKNCPSMKESFGNISDTSLGDALQHPDFKKYWNITKDEISKCRDCEFRYVCTDCRAYLDQPEDLYSAPLKCGYDPYTCSWQDWSTHPMKQKSMLAYAMQGL